MHTNYTFTGGFPDDETIRQTYDDSDLVRAITAYKVFYPAVSGMAIMKGSQAVGVAANSVSGTLDTKPKHVGFTLNSDTPYAPLFLDLSDGPLVINIPEGPIIAAVMNLDQHWLADMGVPGPDAGKGGKYLILPPGYTGETPEGYYVAQAATNKVFGGMRSLPIGGDVPAALERLKKVTVSRLNGEPLPITWLDLTAKPQDTTPLKWEDNLHFWEALYELIDTEPPFDLYHAYYGELAALGIEKGKPFQPDARMKNILEHAAKTANMQMRVESFANRRPDSQAWADRTWEWAALRFENGDFETPNFTDLEARNKWFFQAIASSPAMFRRQVGFGSLYWLGLRDATGAFLDGAKTYKLTVPLPVPAKLFWSVTVYDAETRSQIQTDQAAAALRSLFELKDKLAGDSVDLYFGPKAPKGKEQQWIKTLPGKGWFVYFRIYGPEEGAFDGSWKPGDFEEL